MITKKIKILILLMVLIVLAGNVFGENLNNFETQSLNAVSFIKNSINSIKNDDNGKSQVDYNVVVVSANSGTYSDGQKGINGFSYSGKRETSYSNGEKEQDLVYEFTSTTSPGGVVTGTVKVDKVEYTYEYKDKLFGDKFVLKAKDETKLPAAKRNVIEEEMKRINKELIDAEKDNKDIIKEANGGRRPPDVRAANEAYVKDMTKRFYGRLSTILSGHLERVFGEHLYSAPAYICGDSLYADTTNQKDKEGRVLTGTLFDPPDKPIYKSRMQKQLLEDIWTLQLAGEKTELSSTLYRYAVSIKMIGDSSKEWNLYLYNSCTEESSREDAIASDGSLGWYEYGRISNKQFFGNHYAGGAGNDMIFDCDLGESCRFNEACIEFEGSTEPYCVTLANGGGFKTKGSTGSLSC